VLILSILSILLSNAVNLRQDVTILYNRIAILSLSYCVLMDYNSLLFSIKNLGIHGGLLLITNISQIFHIFIFLITIFILVMTSFYPRKV